MPTDKTNLYIPTNPSPLLDARPQIDPKGTSEVSPRHYRQRYLITMQQLTEMTRAYAALQTIVEQIEADAAQRVRQAQELADLHVRTAEAEVRRLEQTVAIYERLVGVLEAHQHGQEAPGEALRKGAE